MRSLTQSSAGIPASHLPLTTSPYITDDDMHTPQHHVSNHHNTVTTRYQLQPAVFHHNPNPFFNVDNSSVLSIQAKDHINQAIQGGWASTTINRYTGAIKQFMRFCDSEHIPNHLRFPADEFVLCAFAASSLGRHAGSTPRSRISALKAWHIIHNIEWKGSARLRYVLNGVHRLAPGCSKRPTRPPIDAKMLSQLIENLDLNSPIDAAVAACAATAFWGQCRLGELLPSSLATSLSTPFPTRSGFNRSLRNPQSCIFHLPRTKTHHNGQDIVLVDQCSPINPIFLLKNHLRVNNIPKDEHIFSYTSADHLVSLTKSFFLQRCNTVWHLLGYPRATGHCFRIGGTTELLIAGTPPDVVKVTGRWSSESFLRYWRSLDEIAPQHIRNLHILKRKRNNL